MLDYYVDLDLIGDKIKNKWRIVSNFLKQRNCFKLFKFFIFIIIIASSSITIKNEISQRFFPSKIDKEVEVTPETEDSENSRVISSNCNVINIKLQGLLDTYSEEISSEKIVYNIEAAEKDDSIKAIILEVDSFGGVPVAGEEVNLALKRATKPTIALIRGSGLSAAYMAASGASRIFASENSDIGSIGVTMSYVNYVKQNQKEGLDYISLSSGKFKDSSDPNKPLTQAERNLFMRDINIIHQNFVKMVAKNRNLDIKKVAKLADGSSMLGEMALKNGLIDEIGGMSEVKEYIKKEIEEDAEVCSYE